VRTPAAPGRALLWFALVVLGVHAGAWVLIQSGRSFWHGAGIACAAGFLVGLLAGALRLMNPMDADALGEPVIVPSTLPGRSAPILFLATFFGMVATPVIGLPCYLILAYAKSCVDARVLAIFGLSILSSLILSSPSGVPFAAAFGIYSRLGLPSMMLGWACSSLFRSGDW
jgi:hypothetical protein